MKDFARRTGGWGLALGAMLALALAGADTASAATAKKVAEKTFDFAPDGQISIESRNGRIVIDAWDRPQVRVQITRSVRAADDAQAQALLKELQADVELLPGHLEIVSRYPKRRENVGLWDFLGRKVAAMDIHYYLQVPRGSGLTLETTNGEIRVRGTTKSVEARTTNGDIAIAGASGPVEVQTTNGELQLTAIAGDVSGATTNGSVRAEIGSLAANGSVELETTNGNVTVFLPASLKATMNASTTNGKVTSSFPLTVSGAVSSKTIRGTIGGGKGAALAFATTNGNIQVLKIGERGE
ncbi:MAG TPA: DUF4097 family beta strand repeat-containing protein [Candidatus Eisenbacteria bacterium]|nr:DUF4097 family beta strand repeat-containing protein [Candidatus Eisenbacteria bacterium]